MARVLDSSWFGPPPPSPRSDFLTQGKVVGTPNKIVNNVNKKTHRKNPTQIIFNKHTKRKVRRVKRKNAVQYLNMFSNNFAGLKDKMASFTSELKNFNAAIFTGQETHSKRKGLVKVKDFETFEAIIPNKEKQGSIIGVHKALKPMLIEEYCETFELIVVQIIAANRSIRVITGKRPHENYPEVVSSLSNFRTRGCKGRAIRMFCDD